MMIRETMQNCLESTESTVVLYYFTVTGNNYELSRFPAKRLVTSLGSSVKAPGSPSMEKHRH